MEITISFYFYAMIEKMVVMRRKNATNEKDGNVLILLP